MTIIACDLCVIGAGSGGLSVAAAAAAFGVKVVLIERGKMGGDCLNTGCVPSKALIAAAHQVHAARHAKVFGIDASQITVDYAHVHAHIHDVIATIAPVDSQERFESLGGTVLRGEGRFVSPSTVQVGDSTVSARRFVIAIGSHAAVPPIPGLNDVPYLTNESVFDLKALPARLLVLGGGPIGCELAQSFQRLGSAVTVIEMARPLAKDDPEAAAIVIEAMRRDGVEFMLGRKAGAVTRDGDMITLSLQGEDGSASQVSGTHLLVATGRRPILHGLNLEAGNIASTPRGITVDSGLRSVTNRRVYAVGDVAGGAQFTHAANYHAGLVIRNALFRLPVKVEATAIPWATYTDPELAQAGLTEDAARRMHGDIRVMNAPFHHNDRAIAERDTDGFIKAITTKTGRVLGATIVGRGAGDIAGQWQMAVNQKINIRAFAGTVYPYPTRAEISRRAAIAYFAPSLASPWLRRLIALLRHLG